MDSLDVICTMGKIYTGLDAEEEDGGYQTGHLYNGKCCPRIEGGGHQTIVDGSRHLAVRCHRKSTSDVTF